MTPANRHAGRHRGWRTTTTSRRRNRSDHDGSPTTTNGSSERPTDLHDRDDRRRRRRPPRRPKRRPRRRPRRLRRRPRRPRRRRRPRRPRPPLRLRRHRRHHHHRRRPRPRPRPPTVPGGPPSDRVPPRRRRHEFDARAVVPQHRVVEPVRHRAAELRHRSRRLPRRGHRQGLGGHRRIRSDEGAQVLGGFLSTLEIDDDVHVELFAAAKDFGTQGHRRRGRPVQVRGAQRLPSDRRRRAGVQERRQVEARRSSTSTASTRRSCRPVARGPGGRARLVRRMTGGSRSALPTTTPTSPSTTDPTFRPRRQPDRRPSV